MNGELNRIALFDGLPADALEGLKACTDLLSFARGTVIFRENEPADAVWIVRHGWVFLTKGAGPDAVTIFSMTPDEAICGVSAFDHGVYSATAVAATDSRLLRVPAEAFSALLDCSSEFSRRVLLTCCLRMRHMAEAMSLAHQPVERRIAYALLRLRDSFGNTLPISHNELAHMAGTRLETSIRTLAVFKRRNWLSVSRRRMTIRSARPLRKLVSG
jgi:CRP/FNR family transcriptional regulator